MSDGRGLFDSPIKPLKKKRVRKKVEHTLKGRVVYDRKPHRFSDKDAKRIINNLLFDNNVPQENFFERWVDLVVFLFVLFAKSVAIPLAVDTAVAIVNVVVSIIQYYQGIISVIGETIGKIQKPE